MIQNIYGWSGIEYCTAHILATANLIWYCDSLYSLRTLVSGNVRSTSLTNLFKHLRSEVCWHLRARQRYIDVDPERFQSFAEAVHNVRAKGCGTQQPNVG